MNINKISAGIDEKTHNFITFNESRLNSKLEEILSTAGSKYSPKNYSPTDLL